MLWSWFCRKWWESKHRAWSSDRRLPDARATRKTVFKVRNFNSHLAIGSNGGLSSDCKTRDKFHWGAILRWGGRSSWKLRIREPNSWELENSVLELQADIVELIAERYPFMVRGFRCLTWNKYTKKSANFWIAILPSTPTSEHPPLAVIDSTWGLPTPARDLIGSCLRKASLLERSLDSLQACRHTAGSDRCLWWLCGWNSRSPLSGRTKGESTRSSNSLAYQDWLGHFGATRIISQGWSLRTFSSTRPSITNGGNA